MTSRGIRSETLLASRGKCNGDIVVAWTLRCKETKKLNTGGITFASGINNETHGILNLSSNHETGTHGITRHVCDLVDTSRMHGFIVMVDGENVGFNPHMRESSQHFCIMGEDNANEKGLFIS